ncbi:MAG TPA: DUF5683 domain-containing protein [Candidatus Krumholzibacteriaceae bacterium]|nr:DUF5683 domain-containing protein [Candidatus Krumholzibacteriaceae bacterium]
MKRRLLILRSMTFFTLIILSTEVRAGPDTANSSCPNFESDSKEVKLSLRRNSIVSSILPLKYCDFKYSEEYDIVLEGERYERREGKLTVCKDGEISIRGKRIETCFMNGVFPGYGTYLRGKSQAAAVDFFSIAGALYKLYGETGEYTDLKDRLDEINIALSQAETISEKRDLNQLAYETSRKANLQNKYRKKILLFSSALYAYQLIEPIFSEKPPDLYSYSDRTNIRFRANNRSVKKALLYSFFRPGRGQFYQGKTKRGVFFSSIFVLSGLVSLDLDNQYNKDVSEYNMCLSKLNSSTNLADRRKYSARASLFWEDVEDSKEKRNISLYVLAGIWGWNIIDTLFPGSQYCQDKNYSFNVTPTGCELAFNF